MRHWTRRGLIALALLLGALASAFLGGSVGFFQGYGYALGDTAAKAVVLTGALRSLRAGKSDEAISRLESSLDVLVMEHWAANRDATPIFGWMVQATRDPAVERTLLSAVARYRAEHPTTAEGANVRHIISSHLRSFENK
jgi:hypothetical protein